MNHYLWVAAMAAWLMSVRGTFAQESNPVDSLLAETPPVSDVVEAALRHADVFRGGVNRWQTRSRAKAVLPVFEVSVSRNVGDGTSVDTSRTIFGSASTETSPGQFGNIIEGPDDRTLRQSKDEGKTLRFAARWSLDEMIFNPDELRAAREAQNLVDLRGGLSRQVVDLYYTRLKLLALLRLPSGLGLVERTDKQLQADRASAELDALTGGFFAQELKRLKKK
ncbi:MAG: hypothetical protein HYT87_03930 [Nitrospirae bacterium]|nr:hypothetical protein [Nitrospirota bacterium]